LRRFILTGAPGSGKTTLLRYLEGMGHAVVEEAATDVIAEEQRKGTAEPWREDSFVERILTLQEHRQVLAAPPRPEIQIFDRSPLDTLALCRYSRLPVSSALYARIRDAQAAGKYESDVFFIENLGFCEPSAARRISYQDALRFEAIHEETYGEWGYQCVKIPPNPVRERAGQILRHIERSKTGISSLNVEQVVPAGHGGPAKRVTTNVP